VTVKVSLVLVVLASSIGCTDGGTVAAPGQVAFLPPRASIQDLRVTPSDAVAGATVMIRFRVARTGNSSPLFWTSHLVENPPQGGTLSASRGGPLLPGADVEIAYRTRGATVAFVTLYPASTPDAPTGDGTGDWESFAIPVTAAP
jgi:hypothetical protein